MLNIPILIALLNLDALIYLALLALFALGIGALFGWRSGNALPGMGYAMMGAVIGAAMGLSETPVVGTILPAVLTLVAGFSAYLFAKSPDQKPLVGVLIVSLCLMTITGIYVGASLRLSNSQLSVRADDDSAARSSGFSLAGSEDQFFLQVTAYGSDIDDLQITRLSDILEKEPLYSGALAQENSLILIGEDFVVKWPESFGRSSVFVQASATSESSDSWILSGEVCPVSPTDSGEHWRVEVSSDPCPDAGGG